MHFNIQHRGLILLVAFALATVSAILTVTGMTALFKGAITITVVAFIILEITKLTLAGWLIVGRQTFLKVPLIIAMLALMALSLWGHYGFWIEAYTQDTAVKTVIEDKSDIINKQIARYEDEYDELQSVIDRTADNFQTARLNLVQEKKAVSEKLDSLYAQLGNTTVEAVEQDLQIGPFQHLGAVMGMTQDGVARLISLWVSLIMDPVAVLLIMIGVQKNDAAETRRKKRRKKDTYVVESTTKLDIVEDRTPPEPGEQLGVVDEESVDRTPVTNPDTTTIVISGKSQDAIYKLAVVFRLPSVHIVLSEENRYIEDLCTMLPNIVRISYDTEIDRNVTLGDNPSYSDGWLVDYYTGLADVASFTRAEWAGLLHPTIAEFKQSDREGIYLNLEDATLEQSIKSRLADLVPGTECFCETTVDQRTTGLLDTVRRAIPDKTRVVTLGPISATFELFGLDHIVYQGGISDKVAEAYRLPGTNIVPASEDSLVNEILNA